MSTARYAPSNLQSLVMEEARARSVLARLASNIAIDTQGRWHASVIATLPFSQSDRVDIRRVCVDWAGVPFVLELPPAALRSLVEDLLSGAQIDDVPEELAIAALEMAFAPLAVALGNCSAGAPRLVSTPIDYDYSALSHRLVIHLQTPELLGGFEITVCTVSRGLQLAAAAAARRSHAIPLRTVNDDAIPLRQHLALGCTRLPLATVTSLRQHDVVLFDEVWWRSREDGTSLLHLRADARQALVVALTDGRLEVVEPWKEIEMTLTDSSQDDQTRIAIDDLRVTLKFDLGELDVSIGDLRGLAVGQIFDFGRPLGSAIYARINGALVAEGELVEIDGRAGMVLTRLMPSAGEGL